MSLTIQAELERAAALWHQGRLALAISQLTRAVDLEPFHPEARAQLAWLKAHACDWSNIEEDTTFILAMMRQHSGRIDPFIILGHPSSSDDKLHASRQWAQQFASDTPTFPPRLKAGRRKICLGYPLRRLPYSPNGQSFTHFNSHP
jgi:predicted O-linked N-acetylglucosamine transferase (SPINDLY family)